MFPWNMGFSEILRGVGGGGIGRQADSSLLQTKHCSWRSGAKRGSMCP